jgi:hypothetical protein
MSVGGPIDAILARGASLLQKPRSFRPPPGGVSSVPQGPDLYALLDARDPQGDSQVRNLYTETRQSSLEARNNLEMSWWKKLLYVDGHQWIYNNGRGEWKDKRLARWIPRPVTNICAETISSIRAMLTAVQPSARIRPNGTDPKNVITAQLLDDLEPALAEEHSMKTRWFEADFWAPTLGCCWLHPHWDRDDTTHEVFITAKQCAECGMLLHPLDLDEDDFMGCPQCGAPPETFQDAMDPMTGDPIGQSETVGCGRTLVVSPLEILIPTYVQRWEDVDRLIFLRWRPESYYKGRPYAEQIRMSSSTGESSLEMYRSLATTTDLTRGPFMGSGSGAQNRVKGAIEAELWVKPCADFPQGLWARFAGGQHGESVIIRDEDRGVLPGPLPYQTKKGKRLWPWVYYPYELVGGRLYPKGALDSILTKQDSINQGDSMVKLIMQRMANPVWLEPKGSEVNRFTGEPGLIVRYNVVAGTQAKPERLDGMAPNQVFFQLREQDFHDAERLVGTQDVLKGMKPGGVEAFSALNLLVERSQSRFTALFSARGEAYRVWLELAIELERSYGPDTRVRSIAGPNNTWTFKQFLNADLQGAVQVIIEDGSTTPKTSLGKRAMLQEAKGMGFINSENPDTQYAALELLGGTSLAPGLNAHTKAAQIEQELYVQWVRAGRQGPTPLVVQAWHAHPIHIQQLDLWANTDAIRTLVTSDPIAKDEITLHRVEHILGMSNPFGLPAPVPGMMPGQNPDAPGGELGPPQPGQAEGAGRALLNSGQESNAVDTLPGIAPGGGNMGAPA